MGRHEYPIPPAQPTEPIDYDWNARRQFFEELNFPGSDRVDVPPRVTTRTLLIASTQDDRDVEETAEQLPDIRIVRTETGHWIRETEPEKFLTAVRRFLEH